MKRDMHEKIFVLYLGLIVLNSIYSLFDKFSFIMFGMAVMFAFLTYGIYKKKRLMYLLSSGIFFIWATIAWSSIEYTTLLTTTISIIYLIIPAWFVFYSLAIYEKLQIINYKKTLMVINFIVASFAITKLGVYIVVLTSGVAGIPDVIMSLIVKDIITLLILVFGTFFWHRMKE